MKLFLRQSMAGLLSIGLLAAYARSDEAPASQPATARSAAVSCADPTHAFGTLDSEKGEVECVFDISNNGDLPLMITRVDAGCGCTRVAKYSRAVEPGESGEVRIFLDPKKLPSGPFNRAATIYTNDPKQPALSLRMTGVSRHPIDLTPYAASFGLKLETGPTTKTIKIINNTETPLELKMQPVSEADRKKFDITLVETEPGKAFDFLITSKPPYTRGATTSATYTFDTNIDEMKQLKIPASIITPKRIDMRPPAIVLKKTPENVKSLQQQIVSIRMFDDKPIKVLDFHVDDPQISVKEIFRQEGSWYRYQVDIPSDIKLPDTGRTLSFRLADEQTPELKLQILEPKPTPQPANLVGKPAPTFSLDMLNGKPAASDDFVTHPATVLNFVAEQCPFCKRQIPGVEKVRAEYEGRGIRFVNVVGPFRGKKPPNDEIRKSFDAIGSKLDIAIDDGNKVARLYNANSFPALVIIDRKGTITYAVTGAKSDIDQRLRHELDRLLAGGPDG